MELAPRLLVLTTLAPQCLYSVFIIHLVLSKALTEMSIQVFIIFYFDFAMPCALQCFEGLAKALSARGSVFYNFADPKN